MNLIRSREDDSEREMMHTNLDGKIKFKNNLTRFRIERPFI